MVEASPANSNIGFTYSAALAEKMGLAAAKASNLKSPLLGMAIEIKPGIAGPVTDLHVFIDSQADIRLPEEKIIFDAGPNTDMLPFGLMSRLRDREVRRHLFDRGTKLIYLVMNRHGRAALDGAVQVTEDKNASYTAMPVIAYMKEFLPGVHWIRASANSELLAHEDYRFHHLYFEKAGTLGKPLSQHLLDPDQVTEVEIPPPLIEGMRSDLKKVADRDNQKPRQPITYKTF